MSDKTVKLGLMPPLTGLVGLYGSEIVHAAQIACQEINDNGGVLGRPLELIIEDDGSLPDSAVAAAKKLVDEHQCSAIIGNLLSNSRIAVAYQIAEPRKLPYLNFSFYEGSILSRYFFHFAALPNQQIHRMIPYMREKFGPKMFFAGNNYEWPRGSIDAGKIALEQVGGVVIGEEYLPIGVDLKEIDVLLDHVEAASPDVFVPYFAGADQILLLTRFTERGMKKKMAVVMGHYDEMMASTLSPEVREGFYSSNTYFMAVDTDESRNFLSSLAKLPDVSGIWPDGNGILTNFGEGTYLCVKAFAQAANAAGSLDAESLIGILKDIKVTSPQGVVEMNPEHHHAKVNTYLSRCDADGVFNIIETFGAIEPELPERYNHQRISHQAILEDDIRLQARMLEKMSDAILLVSINNGSIIYTNASAERMFDYAKGEMIGLPIAKLHDPVENDPQKTSEAIKRILNGSGEWAGEVRNIKKDGTPIWCHSTISTFTHPVYGEVWLSVIRDITKNKNSEEAWRESEARYRRVERGTNDGLWEWNIPTGINYYSPRWMMMLGYDPDELPSNVDTFTNLIHPEDKEKVWAAVDSHLKNRTLYDIDIRLRCKNDEYLWVRARGESERDDLGNPTIMSGSIADITERKKYEAELKNHREHLEELVKKRTIDLEEARDIAEEASKAKNDFLSRMSHELRTPMNAILGFAQLLSIDELNEIQYSYVNEILDGGDHLLKLINELLDLSRIEAGKMEVVMQPVKVKTAIEYAVNTIHPLIEKMNLTLHNYCNDELTVLADPTRFNQILINLLSNAAKYNRKNGKIGIECQLVLQNRLRISISDTGFGIKKNQFPDLFEPFNRLGAETRGIDGTGIGLALTKQLVALMGGEIFVDSIPDKGSIFSFELTVSENTAISNKDNKIMSENTNIRKTVLYIEDNAANMRVVEAIIQRKSNINLLSAIDGEYGLELAKKYLPDLILLDIHLPKMGGYEVFEKLKSTAATKNIPVIALTADAMPIDIEKGLKAGFFRYITKPIKIDLLMNAVDAALKEVIPKNDITVKD